ncbi:hypothetical protein [Mucilaginibacter sp. L3T2-6]|uniref:hypothetical protein n=1 Tax=Mucilaginibacter sp. L3T2-6 TaxID=3062491 RepID=UPI00267568BD|nr:hypothetical protein [Mucilaginibacter sp. L3T2-6]MDO3642139.1 hypothetical protein [Mucilaginibacter sp. L3T2-6]MDV6214633.1 hypothetical protein [Mucilaginibacter sp. L3T2-6]
MKLTLTVLLATLCVAAKSQTANIKIVKGGYYQTDTLKGEKIPLEDDANHTFKISIINYYSKFFASEYRGQNIFINTEQIRYTTSYNVFLKKISGQTKFLGQSPEYIEDVKLYGKYLGGMLYAKIPVVGMSKGMIEKCLGRPDSSNSSESKYYDSDLWTYSLGNGLYKYVYFYNGSVSSIEDIRL